MKLQPKQKPFPKAVKNEEAKMLKPVIRNDKENNLKPLRVRLNSSSS